MEGKRSLDNGVIQKLYPVLFADDHAGRCQGNHRDSGCPSQWCHSYEGHSKGHVSPIFFLMFLLKLFKWHTPCVLCPFSKFLTKRTSHWMWIHISWTLANSRDGQWPVCAWNHINILCIIKLEADESCKLLVYSWTVLCGLQKHRWCGQDNGRDQWTDWEHEADPGGIVHTHWCSCRYRWGFCPIPFLLASCLHGFFCFSELFR